MNKSTRKAIAKRRARARRRKRVNYGIAAILVLVLGAGFFFIAQNHSETAQEYSGIDANKTKGSPDAPVLVVEYGDFQ
jgi:hypothetical protein